MLGTLLRSAQGVRGVLLPLVLAACAGDAANDVPPATPLTAAAEEFPEPFTGPIRMVELRDGRVLLMDTRERRLLRVDFANGTFDTVSRQGDGPLEYRSIFVLAPAPGDSAWGFDLVRRRILVFSPDGLPIRGFDAGAGLANAERLSSPWLRSVNTDGAWLGRAKVFEQMPPRISDTVLVLRVNPARAAPDTVARLQDVAPLENANRSQVITAFTDTDAWAGFADGRVLVVRGATYGIELHHADGRVDSVGTIPHRRVPLTRADAEYVRDSIAKQTGALVAQFLANLPELRGAPPPPTHVLPEPLPTQWPLLVDDDEIRVDRQQRAWLRVRTAAFDTGAGRYDLLDRDGRFLRAVELPAAEMLVGFGRAHLFTARRDADDLLWLRRYPLP